MSEKPSTEPDLRKALEADPADWQSRKDLAHLLYDRGDFQQAADLVWDTPEIPAIDIEIAFAARVLASVGDSDRAKVEAWQAALPPLSEEIEQRIAARKTAFTQQGGDIAMGQQLFTKHCAACHQIAGQGAVVGPQLDGIGLRGLDRLTEDLFDPNRNVDVAFRPTLLETEDGSTLAGLIKQESETTVTLVDNQGKEIVVDVETIVGRQPSTLSLMPDSLAADIPETDMLNLLAYLLSQKSRPE